MHKKEWVSVLRDDNVETLKRYTHFQRFGVDTKDKHGNTPLHASIYAKLVHCFDYLIEAKADVFCKTKDGKTSLHLACEADHYVFIVTLLAMGVDPNARDKKGMTPLLSYLLANRYSIETIDVLLKNGANIHAVSSTGLSVLDFGANMYFGIYMYDHVKQRERFSKQLCFRGAWYVRTPHDVRSKGLIRYRRTLCRCQLAVSSLGRILYRKGVHKDIVPVILKLVWKSRKCESLWNL